MTRSTITSGDGSLQVATSTRRIRVVLIDPHLEARRSAAHRFRSATTRRLTAFTGCRHQGDERARRHRPPVSPRPRTAVVDMDGK